MGQRIVWTPRLIENVRNDKFSKEDFDFLVGELAGFFYSQMLKPDLLSECSEETCKRDIEIKLRVDD